MYLISILYTLFIVIVIILIAVAISSSRPGGQDDPNRPHDSPYTGPWIYQPNDLGEEGELFVRRYLKHDEIEGQFVINDYMVQLTDGFSMEVDHIVINQNGVFVIETKNIGGIISGHEKDARWKQTMEDGFTVNVLLNPIRQNEGHIRGISQILGRVGIYHNVVIILRANVRVASRYLVPVRTLPSYLSNRTEVWLSRKEAEAIYRVLLNYREGHAISKSEHIVNLRRMEYEHSIQKERLAAGLCPRCGKPLVLRENDKYGQFWGCEGFPVCRFYRKK